ncbi:hydroxyethylthiazole kinase [Legionella saoudiensis]|uniref:hydroxyethylthiazole kinase n=1 Tax=Legionella saoudiensis TaxID=1750561 RepID=UPI000731392A|nr:hydroxyethylthiazole kinase [Legionella saoudiensis]
MINNIQSALSELRQIKPLVLCLTNYVTMDFMANALLALGAAPLMSESPEEIDELVSLSHALYINIGTLNDAFVKHALLAAKIANFLNKPIILDPVGAGASTLRTSAALEILPLAQVIKGNASEIISLTGANSLTKGVESADPVFKAIDSARALARTYNKVVVISGPEDFITDGKREQMLAFGSELMPLVTGMGCTMAAVLSAFVASDPDTFQAVIHGTAYFGLCGQQTHQQTQAPGSFKQFFIDNLYQPEWNFFNKALKG